MAHEALSPTAASAATAQAEHEQAATIGRAAAAAAAKEKADLEEVAAVAARAAAATQERVLATRSRACRDRLALCC